MRTEDERREWARALVLTADEGKPTDCQVDLLWQAGEGRLSREETLELADRAASDPGLFREWLLARSLAAEPLEEVGGGAGPVEEAALTSEQARQKGRFGGSPVARWTRKAVWLPAAAVLLVGLALVPIWIGPSEDEIPYRGGRPEIQSLAPESVMPASGAVTLRWTAGPTGVRYNLRLATPEKGFLRRLVELPVNEYRLDEEDLASVAGSSRLLWQVEWSVEGEVVAQSETFETELSGLDPN